MDLKLHLKVVQGMWYISLGKRGYKSTVELDKALSEWIEGNEAIVTFTTDRTNKSRKRVVMREEGDHLVMDVYDPNSNLFLQSIKQCPKIFADYGIDKEFYINYSPEWLLRKRTLD